ncbi:MAG: DUF3343 domain-containing protein [Clostridiales Family XIII bacterium]|nr:DUF3343 domain-containing protein [Clostridiales Family XIII bacterium]
MLKAKGVQVRVMPLPVEISGSCGICLRVDAQDAEGAEALLRGAGIGPLSAFQR